MTASELLAALKSLGYPKDQRDAYWWPSSGTFEVVIGAVLTQNTKWEKVEKGLKNLGSLGALGLDGLLMLDEGVIREAIRPVGLYNTKAKRLYELSRAIKERFGSFEAFCREVSRDWLLKQKGLGPESVDSILCYACLRPEMVVDRYTARLLAAFGYEIEDYETIKEWLMEGIMNDLEKIYKLYGNKISPNKLFARFHGKIVEYCKEHGTRDSIDIRPLRAYIN